MLTVLQQSINSHSTHLDLSCPSLMAKGANKPGSSNRTSGLSKKNDKKNPKVEAVLTSPGAPQIPQDLQQSCLNIFRDALVPSADDTSLVQEVKGHLFDRNFPAAFGKEDYLRVYASRWSPSRALCYLHILDGIQEHILHESTASQGREENRCFRVVSLGGGAGGELVALAGWLRSVSDSTAQDCFQSLHVDLIDSADWQKVTTDLHHAIITPPALSPYASQAKKDSNKALLQPEEMSMRFHQIDLLNPEKVAKFDDFAKADLITCMFTLNELYSTSMTKTQQFLTNLTTFMRPGSFLLIVDSPGSYSTVSLNGSEKKYPMQWLLDYTLRGSPGKSDEADNTWARIKSEDSQWFRRLRDLQYPIELEDMRYQLHLYRKADIGDSGVHHGG